MKGTRRFLCFFAACLLALSACGKQEPEDLIPDSSLDTNIVVKGLEGPIPDEGTGIGDGQDPPGTTEGTELDGSLGEGLEGAPNQAPALSPDGEGMPSMAENAAEGTALGEASAPDPNAPLPEVSMEAAAELPASGVVTTPSLNLRSAANTDATVIGGLAQGDRFTALHKMGDWYYIECNLGEGYINGQYARLDGEGFKTQRAELLFYDDVAGQFVTVEKEFYTASWQGSSRRFDAKLSPKDFGWEGDLAVVHPDIQSMAKAMGRALYQSDSYSVNCYFGQYYPSATREDGTEYQTGIHEGIDFGGPALDAPFYSLTDGVVSSVQDGQDHDQYNWIGVKTGGVTVFYVHHFQSFVAVGDAIQKGQKLGLQGDNGARGAYHVHLELVSGDAAIFNRSKDTVLQDDPPYDFWRSQGY